LNGLEARHAELQRILARPLTSAPRLHPNLAEVYRQQVADMQTALNGPSATEARERVRDLIERVVLRPAPGGRDFEIELEGKIAGMTRVGADDQRAASPADRALFDSSVKVVAGIGFEPMTFRL
jgi:site-specific DNA recombinase